MERPTLNNNAAIFQAGTTVQTYLHTAVSMIDAHFGTGYAAEHPALVGECIKAQALDFNNAAQTAALYHLSDQVQEVGSVLCTAADSLCDAINPPPPKRRFDNPASDFIP